MPVIAALRSTLFALLMGASLLLAAPARAQAPQASETPAQPPKEAPAEPSAEPSKDTPPEPPKEALTQPPKPPAEPKKETPWYEKIRIRGYTQFRYNRLPSLRVNDDLINDQGDRFLGRNNGFGIRRARVILFGDIHERVSIYLQPDFASVISDQLNVAIMRDWYADIFLDARKEFRLRVGQSKVPYGFENLQSSQNRLPFDRNDAINSAVKDERDLGIFFYWAPDEIRQRFKHLVDSGLKGSGDYGVVGFGVYNGQTANRPERNDNLHTVGRVTWPFLFGKQFVEVGVGGYYGRSNVTVAPTPELPYALENGENNLVDARANMTLVIYPQPLGFVAE